MKSSGKAPYEGRNGERFEEKPKRPLLPFGIDVMFFVEPEKRRKFDPSGSKGIVVGYSDMGYLVLNLDCAVRSDWNDLRIIKTRDIKVSSPEEFPAKDIEDIPQKGFHATLWGGVEDKATKTCKTCKLPKLVKDAITCRACRGRHRAHTKGRGCALGRCKCDFGATDPVAGKWSRNVAPRTNHSAALLATEPDNVTLYRDRYGTSAGDWQGAHSSDNSID